MKTSRTNFSLAWIVNRCRINRTSRQPWIKTMVEEMEEKSRGTVAFSLFSTLSGYTLPHYVSATPFEPALCTTGHSLWIYVEEKFIRKLDNARTAGFQVLSWPFHPPLLHICILVFMLGLRVRRQKREAWEKNNVVLDCVKLILFKS